MPPVDTTSVDMTADQIAVYSSASEGISSGILAVQIIYYLLISYSIFTIAKKLGEQYAWMAWIPILNIILMFRMAKMSLWWLLGLLVPLFNVYVYIKALHNGVSKRTGHGGWWTAGLVFLSFVFLPLTAFKFKAVDTATPVV
jgi:Family of unknown function (DUF5684)